MSIRICDTLIRYRGKVATLRQWCEVLGRHYPVIAMRWRRGERDLDDLFRPTDYSNKGKHRKPTASKQTAVPTIFDVLGYDLTNAAVQLNDFDKRQLVAYITQLFRRGMFTTIDERLRSLIADSYTKRGTVRILSERTNLLLTLCTEAQEARIRKEFHHDPDLLDATIDSALSTVVPKLFEKLLGIDADGDGELDQESLFKHRRAPDGIVERDNSFTNQSSPSTPSDPHEAIYNT